MNINVLRLRRHSTENIIIALSIIFSSFVGMQFLGISLNKIALLPLIIYLLMHFRKKISLNKGQKMLILFYVFSIASVISGFLIQEKIQGLQEKLGLYFAQVCLMYIPLTLLSNNLKDPIGVVKKTLIFMARVNAIWAVVQSLSYRRELKNTAPGGIPCGAYSGGEACAKRLLPSIHSQCVRCSGG